MKLNIHCSVLMLGLALAGCSTTAKRTANFFTGGNQHYKAYLQQCGTNEIRCLWFLQDDPRYGMEMTVHFNDRQVETAKDVYDWGLQDAQAHKMEDYEVYKLQDVISHLPPSDSSSEYNSSVFVARHESDKTEIFQYDRHFTPPVIHRIYDLAGGYFYTDEDE